MSFIELSTTLTGYDGVGGSWGGGENCNNNTNPSQAQLEDVGGAGGVGNEEEGVEHGVEEGLVVERDQQQDGGGSDEHEG